MKVLLAGATGALGAPLTSALLADGHEVIALSRRQRPATPGVKSVVADALDRDALLRAVDGLHADAVIHELTALSKAPTRHSGMAQTDRLRIEGTTNLLAAADAIGARRFVTQSIIFGYGYRDLGDRLITEDDPFGRPQGGKVNRHLAALLSTEQQAFTAPEGIALRYGLLYGGDVAALVPLLQNRRLPVSRGGVLGWVHHADAAAATVAALDRGRAGEAYNIVDDLPVSWADLFTAMAVAVGAPEPRRLPPWLMRMAAPYVATFAVGTSMRVSNAKARAELGWRPQYRTYRDGLAAVSAARRANLRSVSN
jgi:nucleoside-diphosphate-sugar epimerase